MEKSFKAGVALLSCAMLFPFHAESATKAPAKKVATKVVAKKTVAKPVTVLGVINTYKAAAQKTATTRSLANIDAQKQALKALIAKCKGLRAQAACQALFKKHLGNNNVTAVLAKLAAEVTKLAPAAPVIPATAIVLKQDSILTKTKNAVVNATSTVLNKTTATFKKTTAIVGSVLPTFRKKTVDATATPVVTKPVVTTTVTLPVGQSRLAKIKNAMPSISMPKISMPSFRIFKSKTA